MTADRAKRHVREVLLVDIFFPARADFFLKQAQYFVARKLQFFFTVVGTVAARSSIRFFQDPRATDMQIHL